MNVGSQRMQRWITGWGTPSVVPTLCRNNKLYWGRCFTEWSHPLVCYSASTSNTCGRPDVCAGSGWMRIPEHRDQSPTDACIKASVFSLTFKHSLKVLGSELPCFLYLFFVILHSPLSWGLVAICLNIYHIREKYISVLAASLSAVFLVSGRPDLFSFCAGLLLYFIFVCPPLSLRLQPLPFPLSQQQRLEECVRLPHAPDSGSWQHANTAPWGQWKTETFRWGPVPKHIMFSWKGRRGRGRLPRSGSSLWWVSAAEPRLQIQSESHRTRLCWADILRWALLISIFTSESLRGLKR